MKWIELIRVCSSEATLDTAMLGLKAKVNELKLGLTETETMVLRHFHYDGDLAVVLIWQNRMRPCKTREGLMIAEQLQKIGLVDHAVWVPAKHETDLQRGG
jgi:hypothetical protein